mgnify:CR=1 FL=1
MTTAVFSMRGNEPCGVYVQGHSGYAALGEDIVCSAVTSAVMTTLNGITECTDIRCEVEVLENEIILNLAERKDIAEAFLMALKIQLEYIRDEYDGTIKITVTEV